MLHLTQLVCKADLNNSVKNNTGLSSLITLLDSLKKPAFLTTSLICTF